LRYIRYIADFLSPVLSPTIVESVYKIAGGEGGLGVAERVGSTRESERSGIADSAANSIQGTRAEFDRHERFGRKRAFERARLLAGEAEARVVVRMAEHDHYTLTAPAKVIEALPDQSPTDALGLMFR
jgi:hypothetical protein